MVVTRSQTFRNNLSESRKMSDNESGASFPDLLTAEQMADLDNDDLLNRQHSNERNAIDQRFYEMKRQIEELTNLVQALSKFPLILEKGMNRTWQQLVPTVVPTVRLVILLKHTCKNDFLSCFRSSWSK